MNRQEKIGGYLQVSQGGLLVIFGILCIVLKPNAMRAIYGAFLLIVGLSLCWFTLWGYLATLDEKKAMERRKIGSLWGRTGFGIGFLLLLFAERYMNGEMNDLVPTDQSSIESNSFYAFFGLLCLVLYVVLGLFKDRKIDEGKFTAKEILSDLPLLALPVMLVFSFLIIQICYSAFDKTFLYLWIPFTFLTAISILRYFLRDNKKSMLFLTFSFFAVLMSFGLFGFFL